MNRSRGNLSRRDHTISALDLVTGPAGEKRKQTEGFAPSTSGNVFSFGSILAGGVTSESQEVGASMTFK